MTILLDRGTRVCVVGVTGGRARADTELNLAYGTTIVCGVAPGRGGQNIAGVPVYDTCGAAAAEHAIDAVIAYLPPRAYRAAMADVLAVRPGWVHVVTEGIPLHDNVAVLTEARRAGVRLIGPNTSGIISPGRAKVGFMAHASWLMSPGRLVVLSRSGGFTHDLAYLLSRSGFGISTAVGIGGDAVAGSSFADFVALAEDDPETDAVVLYGEAGPAIEREVADGVRSGRFRKPVVALVAGDFLEDHAHGAVFGHAGAFLEGPETTATAKREALRAGGVHVATAIDDIPHLLAAAGVPATGTASRP
ncbi:succinate--CoA ligase subunit alpha [Dactylosporangium sp. CS-033363]|uniref:succinate--CoA ligase subunit alpha n=1 Tax=Dactylosporangium sp. CS-033363 TaxID=3239935 RepID=UPI003D8FD2FA